MPQELSSCHTAQVAGYLVEGHVPAGAIKRLLVEKPQGIGLAVPGMPAGSPGMEVEGMDPATYDIVLFGSGEPSTFARYRGAEVKAGSYGAGPPTPTAEWGDAQFGLASEKWRALSVKEEVFDGRTQEAVYP